MRFRSLPSWILVVTALSGCSPSGDGEIDVTLYGEDFVEHGIPADETADGWSVTFDRFVVTVDDVTVGGVTVVGIDPVDISEPTDGAGHLLATAPVPAGSHTDPGFTLSHIEVAGSAVRDGVTKTFDWTFDQRTRYSACETTTEVLEGETATFEITIHADHFFYDSLVAEDPELVFQGLADADADADGEITRAELQATGIGGLDPGSEGGIDDLWAWLVAQGRTLGHVDGEGHCDALAD